MTKKTNVIIPEIMGPAIGARLDKALRLMPYAKIDSTLENNEGDEVTIPVWEYSGDAVDVAEGEEVETSQLNATTRKYKVKKAMKAFPITDEAQMSAHGSVGEEAESQLVKSIKGKIDNDLINECYGETVKTIELSGALDYTGIVKGVAAFGFESNPAKVLFINPVQEAAMLLNPYFKDKSKFNAPVGIEGVIGMIAGCYVKKSKKVRYVEPTTEHGGYWLNPIVIIDDEKVEDEDPTPALTIFVKKEFRLEVSRDTLSQISSLVGSKHYLAALTNASKVVVVKSVVADPTSYTLSYNGNGGEGSVESQEGTELTIAANAFTKAGYSFVEWNTAADGSGTSYDEGDTITLSADVTLYAIWELITYTLSYDGNGGTGTMSDQEGIELTVAANAFEKAGYRFVEWNTAAVGSGTSFDEGDTIELGSNVTLYAIWELITYTLSYDANGGTGTMSDQEGVELTVAANAFTKEGYSFVKWNTASDGSGTDYDPSDSITLSADVTLYAIWAQVIRTLSYDANGGSGTMSDQTVGDGGSLTVASNSFTKSGYTFSKWNTASDGSGTDYDPNDSITMTSDVTLYAIWEQEIIRTLSYDGNGGTGTVASQTVADGGSLTVAANGFEKTGYSFVKWNTAADGSGTDYSPAGSITMTADVTLYAQWALGLSGLQVNGSFDDSLQYTDIAPDVTGLSFSAMMTDGSTKPVTPTVSPATWGSTAGTQTATFSYTENGTTVTVSLTATVNERIFSVTSSSGNKGTIKVISGKESALVGDITLPETLYGYQITGIATNGLANCQGITSLVLPASYSSIGGNAFGGYGQYLNNLTSIVFESTTPPTLQTGSLYGIPLSVPFTVPYSADHSVLNAYKAKARWSDYASRIVEWSPYIGSWTDPNFSAGGGDPYMLTVVADQDYWQPQMSLDNGTTFEALQAKTAYTLNQDGSLDVVIVSLGNVQAHIELVNGSVEMSVGGNVISTMTKDSTTKPFLPYSN